ncbi:DUF2726 domain-containing protein [Salmonella enterica]|uniref:DUF2726 domain-containing protein n=1 Tax=Salmonella enterica TaxID=28901 RepID=UPI001079A681|nr:DUF2726 domain-containing protein [Salmonella enterica]EIQ0459698.1 DUF2726 domain-containing protein [Salmonella enterica subsp. enterica]EAA9736487.1 DUF2726 domain-containing protein [Salmonella enterica]EAS2829394.1 DUF2726 domain-containing protein [Salmonella enterica]EAU0362260.1 DUF2726 domain-containing protein [Salmonella enterica]EAU0844763.1 hypothetical protein [Salmonella enterica]
MSFMSFVSCLAIAFALGIVVARKLMPRTGYKLPPTAPAQPATYTPKPYVPVKKYRDSRWQERDELFQGMVDEGVWLEGKEWLITRSEKIYFDNLEKWFGQYCHIHCQVSLGRLVNFPEQPGFSEEERKRFFMIYNNMAMDYVLVSKKNNKIVCVIELDDPSHERADRITRDRWLNIIMSIAQIPFVRASVTKIDEEPPVWQTRDAVRPFVSATKSEKVH